MIYDAQTVDDYIGMIPEERREPFSRLRQTILSHLPKGFEEGISYKMPSWVVPLSIYPDGADTP